MNISLSSHEHLDELGWGLNFPEGENAWQYYSLYEYISSANTNQVYKSNIIDWDSPSTTLQYSASSYADWSQPGGTMEIILERQLRKGLNFFSGKDSLDQWRDNDK